MTRLIKLENLAIGVAAVLTYYVAGYSVWLFVLLILAPDISFVGYLISPKAGAICYNCVHTYICPAVLLALGHVTNSEILMASGLIIATHIGFDRLLGYGLKYESGFKDTHLGRIGGG